MRALTRAWIWLGRACELGEPEACDDAARLAGDLNKWTAAETYEQEARWLRANPVLTKPHHINFSAAPTHDAPPITGQRRVHAEVR